MPVSMNKTYLTPGVYLETIRPEPAFVLETGVPVFIGLVRKKDLESLKTQPVLRELPLSGLYRIEVPTSGDPRSFSRDEFRFPKFVTWEGVKIALGGVLSIGFLGSSVQGFFQNGGKTCFIYPLCYDPAKVLVYNALAGILDDIGHLEDIDLICAPDLVFLTREDPAVSAEDLIVMQSLILDHCANHIGRFAILDSLSDSDADAMRVHRSRLTGDNGALYYPWLKTVDPLNSKVLRSVPACGHVCGIYARCGVNKAPANEELKGVTDLDMLIGNAEQERLNPVNINCIRSFPGRGIRVWGARTLSRNPEWTYVNVRRLFLTLSRWLEGLMQCVVLEPNDPALWGRINREVTDYLNGLYIAGALKGNTPKEAFYVICDASLNPVETRDQGQVVTEIGVAPASPCEFIIVRIIHSDNGIRIVETTDQGSTGTPDIPPSPVIPGSSELGTPWIAISHIEYTVSGYDVTGEYVKIENRDNREIDLGNWTLRDKAGHVFRFPMCTLKPGASYRIWTKAGTNTATDLFWGHKTAVWNNTGDQAVLRDRNGRTVNVYVYSNSR